MHRENGDVHVAGAAHVLLVAAAKTRQRDAGDEYGIRVLAAPRRERRLDFAVDDGTLLCVLDVDDRRFA
jgi:hypothetical protein